MANSILDVARKYLLNSLHGKPNRFESKHPWRNGWEFAVLHSLRVESYVTKILAREGEQALSEREILLLRLAAILHDIGRLDQREGHAQLGAEIAKTFLHGSSANSLKENEIARVTELIADHSNKEAREPDFSKAILKDADTLDEIGGMSILMAVNWLDARSPYFFSDLRQRLVEFEIPYCDKKLAILNTHGAREILAGKKAFIENFVSQIAEETEGTVQMEQVLHEWSKNNPGS